MQSDLFAEEVDGKAVNLDAAIAREKKAVYDRKCDYPG